MNYDVDRANSACGMEGKMADHVVRVLTWVKAGEAEIRTGLLGWICVEYGVLVLDGICLRRTADRRLALSFPARVDRAGRKHSYLRPVDDAARQAIEAEILWQLGERPEFVP